MSAQLMQLKVNKRSGRGRPSTRACTCSAIAKRTGQICGKPCAEGKLCYYHEYEKRCGLCRSGKRVKGRVARQCYHITKKGTQCTRKTTHPFCSDHAHKHSPESIAKIIESEQRVRAEIDLVVDKLQSDLVEQANE